MHEGAQFSALWLLVSVLLSSTEFDSNFFINQLVLSVSSGDNVTLECSLNDINTSVIWIKYPNQTSTIGVNIDTENGRYETYTNQQLRYAFLIIRNVSRNDRGIYECHSSRNGNVFQISRKIRLEVQLLLSSTEIDSNLFINQLKVSVSSGDTVTLQCSLNDINASVIWIKYPNQTSTIGVNIDTENGCYETYTSQQLRYTFLIIRNVSRNDRGIYECHSSGNGNAFQISRKIRLEVQFPSIIYNMDNNVVAAEVGDDIQLFCNSTGYPLPNITWRRVSRSMPPLDDIVFTGRRLNISNVQKDDGGKYSCESYNGIGKKASWDVFLRVKFSPEITTPIPDVGQAVNYSTELSCLIESFPLPVVRWFKEDQELGNDTHYSISLKTSDNHIMLTTHLTIYSVRRTDFGNYSCHAENAIGYATTVVTLSESPFPVLPLVIETPETPPSPRRSFYSSSFNVTGFILGMMPPLLISFYIILHLGFRSRYAEERPEEEGGGGLDEIVWEQGLRLNTKF